MKSSRTRWRPWMAAALGALVAAVLVGASYLEKDLEEPIEAEYSVAAPEFRAMANHLFGFPLTGNQRIRELINGDEIFPAMLKAIAEARESITLETYIWASGRVSDRFIEALSERARAGVRVHVILDGIGCVKLTQADRRRLSDAGIRWVRYGRERWYDLKLNLNHRTHRKLMVVDGVVGFVGGVCISDEWAGDADRPDRWRDTHFLVEGPVVKQLQAIFTENWLESTGELLEGPAYFPPDGPQGSVLAQAFKSGPREGEERARLAYLLSVAAAQRSIRLSHAYFLPDELAVGMLVDACRRGVDIEVVVPGPLDSPVGKAASRSRWGELMEAGVKFFEYQGALYHCKVMVVDEVWVTAGSVNFDERSFRINDEANINVLDRKFASAQLAVFAQDKARSRPLSLADLERRGWFRRAMDRAAGLLRFQL